MLDKNRWQQRFKELLSIDSHPGHIAAGFAVGTFISFTPFFGAHTFLAIALAFLFRLNKVTCITGSWVNTPLTVVPVLGLAYRLGRAIRGLPPAEVHFRSLEWTYLKKYATSLLIGTSLIGFVMAIIAYFACYYLVVRFRQRDETMAAMTGEMEQTGEGLEP